MVIILLKYDGNNLILHCNLVIAKVVKYNV